MAGNDSTATAKRLTEGQRQVLQERLLAMSAPGRETIAPRPPGAPTPISEEQRRIWMHAAMDPDLPIYNESITIHRRGSFDLDALEASFNEVLRRHEAWRTSFETRDGELLQVVHPDLRVRITVTNLTALPEERREPEALRLAAEDARVPIDLTHAPLFRARVLRMAPDHHWLQLTLHHIIFDGISLYRVLVPELAAIYGAFSAGRKSPLPEPVLQYGDYAVWRAANLETPAMARHLDYWRKQLEGELPVLRLPMDRPRPARTSHRGAQQIFTLPQELIAALRALGRSRGVTLYMVLLAGLKTLFFRYSNQQDVIVGGLSDGRRRPELEGLMGYFLDTFAIRTRPSAALPFAEYLNEVLHSVLGALDAAEAPFSRVVEAIKPTRDRSHHPIFQTFLAIQPQAEAFPDGWEMEKTPIAMEVAKFDLYIEVDERAERTLMRFMYSTDLFDAATIARMAGHWQTLLEGFANDPERALGDLPLLTEAERDLMLVGWNRTERPPPTHTLHELVAAQARRTPNAPAIQFEQAAWTYAELEDQSESIAARLRAAGARRGALVAVSLERSQFLPAALLAVLKTGAAYLPLDPRTPRARFVLSLEDAAPAVVLTQQSLLDDLPPNAATVVLVEDASSGERPAETRRPAMDDATLVVHTLDPDTLDGATLDDAAYVIHTSGSTGRPKAVEIGHRALVNLLQSMQREPGFRSSDTLLAVTTISFDIAGLELFLPLIAGGRVVIASREVALDPYRLATAIEDSGCTVLQATPSTWRSLLSVGWRPRSELRVLCGGEPLAGDLAAGLLELGVELWNVYGPTETTIWSTIERVKDPPITVGRPIANTTTYILDPRQQPVPINVPGELYIGGMGVARGYRSQPLLTAEKFVTPAVAGGARLYRTGDNALYRADGRTELQGRGDNQVKIRGHRLELEEVESALAAHPSVAAAAAMAWPEPSGGNRLAAYLVGRNGPPPSARELRQFLESRVPDYMVPSDVIALEAMPLTANGKMDRKALRPPDFAAGRVTSAAPATDMEIGLAAIWAEALGRGSMGIDDNFFDLGGHSLLVARLQLRIEKEFGQQISMAAVFHAPTIRLQAALLQAADTDRSRLIPIQPRGAGPALFWIEPPPLIENLAAALGERRPFLGVTMLAVDLEGENSTPDLEAYARFHMETILKAQPHGPYYLGGLCTGGILAYEVAVQLRAAGHPVASLVLLDSENPVHYRRPGSFAVEAAKLRFYGRRAFAKDGFAMFLRHLYSRSWRLFKLHQAAATEMSAIENAILAAAFRYKPPAYDGDVLLILPSERPEAVDYPSGWRTVVHGTLTCMDVRGHHDDLLATLYAGGVARTINSHFESVAGAMRDPAPALS